MAETADDTRTRLRGAFTRAGKNDPEAFGDVYGLTSAKLFSICMCICGDRAAAEDVLHDVYLAAWQSATAWDPARGSVITWLATIARNRAIDWQRRRRRVTLSPLSEASHMADHALDPETSAGFDQEIRQLHAFLDGLDKRQSQAIRTAFFHGLTYREIAERNDVPLGTVKSHVRRGLAQLKSRLNPSMID